MREIDVITESVKERMLRLFSDKLASVILYGSYARGDYDADSDVDLLILVDVPTHVLAAYRPETARIASRLSLDNDRCLTVSIALQDLETYEKYKTSLPFYGSVASEGMVVYGV